MNKIIRFIFKLLCPDAWHFDCPNCGMHKTFSANSQEEANRKANKMHKDCYLSIFPFKI